MICYTEKVQARAFSIIVIKTIAIRKSDVYFMILILSFEAVKGEVFINYWTLYIQTIELHALTECKYRMKLFAIN